MLVIKYRVITTTQAECDILSIDDYISNELLAPNSAQRILASIERKILSLNLAPERGSLYAKEPWASNNVRTIQVKHYKIIYKVDKIHKTVTILHVSYARRDLDKILRKSSHRSELP